MKRIWFSLTVAALLSLALPFHSHASDGAATALQGTDVAASAGIAETASTWSANLGDYNRDGWQDWVFVRHNRIAEANGATATLYRNNRNGGFVEAKTFAVADRHDCAWGDVNGNRRPDFFCSIGADNGTDTHKANELWIQQADGDFVDRAAPYGVTDPLGRGRYATFINVNHDGFPDLFLGNFFPRKDGLPSPNRLLINQQGDSFRDAPEFGLDREIGSFCAWDADYNNDGWDDLLVCGKAPIGLRLYRNNQGNSFTDVSSQVKISGFWNDAQLVDYNGDSLLDLARVRDNRFQVRLQTGNGTFGPVTFGLELSAGETIAGGGDINLDGAPDIYVVQGCSSNTSGNLKDFMFVNNGSGTSFSEVPIPDSSQGCGDNVSSLDFDRDGRDDYIVLNGNLKNLGPNQLITFR